MAEEMLLAARGLGLASVLTTRPRGVRAGDQGHGPTNRRPVEDVTFDETWGQRWEAAP